ncbi:MAG: OmpA family protein [Desulfobacteraceae bacterium]|nr:OmpA family protein [Desulfobacteraceae bacterium]MBC2719844.1 OmpA family protein [Desulfobacteraceae bacterium]
MSDPHTPNNSKGLPKDDTPDDQLAEIRSLIIGPNQAQLGKLQERLDNPELFARDISRVLPEAVILRSSQDKKLATALMSTIEEVVRSSIKKDRGTLVGALFPVMGPAIRKAVTETFTKMLQSLNQALEKSLSLDGLKWRLEAIRTGKTFAEVVLLHSLVYRVEQVFLIHKETGLLLQHVAGEEVAFRDADMISGMLTAIQDFVRDSFGMQKSEDEIETIQIGELTIWVTQGPELILPAAIRGTAPEELKLVFQEALENIHLEQSDTLESFDGDTAPFETSRHYLKICLQAQYKTKKQKLSPFLWILLGAIIIALGSWGFCSARNHLRWANYLKKINSERGVIVTDAGKRDGKYFISGLRDPLATDPMAVLPDSKFDSENVISHWEPYYALHPEFIIARAKIILNPPETVRLELINNVLHATGSASHQWIAEAYKIARVIPGIAQFHEKNLIDTDISHLTTIKNWIENQRLRFAVNSINPVPGQNDTLRTLAKEIRKLQALTQFLDKRFYIKIIGHTDQSGSEKKNLALSQERANFVASVLIIEGLKGINYKAVGVGSSESLCEEMAEKHREFNRGVSFNIILTDRPTTKGD